MIDDDEDDGKEVSLPSSSMGEVEVDEEKEGQDIAEESILAPVTLAATEIITTSSSSSTTTVTSASQSSTAAFFSPAPTTTAAVVTMPIYTSSSTTTTTTTAFNLDDLYQILIAAFARSKGEVPLKEVLLTAREQWPTLSEVALGKLVAVAEEMNKVMFFEDKIYEI